jgi:F-type H+-transporting ATPase subunit epsilon
MKRFCLVSVAVTALVGTPVMAADMAIKADDIDEMKAEEARKRAEARLQEKLTDEESAMVTASLARSLAQLKVKRRQQR